MGRIYIRDRYGVVPVDILNSPEISFRAKGLYAYLQSKPDGWGFSIDRIASQTKDGVESVRSAVQELEKAGYLRRIPARGDNGRWKGYDYILFASPVQDYPSMKQPSSGNPSTVSLPPISKKDNSKYIYSKKDIDIINKEKEKSEKKENKQCSHNQECHQCSEEYCDIYAEESRKIVDAFLQKGLKGI